VDTLGNESGYSNEVSATPLTNQVAVTFQVDMRGYIMQNIFKRYQQIPFISVGLLTPGR